MLKKYLFIAILLFANVVNAQEVKIGVVDFVYLMKNVEARKSIDEQLDEKLAEFKKQDQNAQTKIVKKQQALAEKKAILPAKDFERERLKLEKEIQAEQEKSKRNKYVLQNGLLESRKFLDSAVRKYIAKVAEKKGLNLIIPKQQVIISEKTLSITNEVFKLINSDLKEVKIKFAKN